MSFIEATAQDITQFENAETALELPENVLVIALDDYNFDPDEQQSERCGSCPISSDIESDSNSGSCSNLSFGASHSIYYTSTIGIWKRLRVKFADSNNNTSIGGSSYTMDVSGTYGLRCRFGSAFDESFTGSVNNKANDHIIYKGTRCIVTYSFQVSTTYSNHCGVDPAPLNTLNFLN